MGENILVVKENIRVKNQTKWLMVVIKYKFKKLYKRYGPNVQEVHRRRLRCMLTADAQLRYNM